MANQTKSSKLVFLSVICILLSIGTIFVTAQSGRRVPNPPPTVKPEPTPEPSPTPKPKEDIKPEYSMIVVSNVRGSMNTNSTFRNPENTYSWVLERLRSSSHLEVMYGGESNMKKATEMAKGSANSYVLLVELAEDSFASPTMGNTTITQGAFWIDFTLYSPTTGKSKLRGRADLRPELLRGTIGNRGRRACFPLMTNNDYLLLEASYEVAERAMDGINLIVPPFKCNKVF